MDFFKKIVSVVLFSIVIAGSNVSASMTTKSTVSEEEAKEKLNLISSQMSLLNDEMNEALWKNDVDKAREIGTKAFDLKNQAFGLVRSFDSSSYPSILAISISKTFDVMARHFQEYRKQKEKEKQEQETVRQPKPVLTQKEQQEKVLPKESKKSKETKEQVFRLVLFFTITSDGKKLSEISPDQAAAIAEALSGRSVREISPKEKRVISSSSMTSKQTVVSTKEEPEEEKKVSKEEKTPDIKIVSYNIKSSDQVKESADNIIQEISRFVLKKKEAIGCIFLCDGNAAINAANLISCSKINNVTYEAAIYIEPQLKAEELKTSKSTPTVSKSTSELPSSKSTPSVSKVEEKKTGWFSSLSSIGEKIKKGIATGYQSAKSLAGYATPETYIPCNIDNVYLLTTDPSAVTYDQSMNLFGYPRVHNICCYRSEKEKVDESNMIKDLPKIIKMVNSFSLNYDFIAFIPSKGNTLTEVQLVINRFVDFKDGKLIGIGNEVFASLNEEAFSMQRDDDMKVSSDCLTTVARAFTDKRVEGLKNSHKKELEVIEKEVKAKEDKEKEEKEKEETTKADTEFKKDDGYEAIVEAVNGYEKLLLEYNILFEKYRKGEPKAEDAMRTCYLLLKKAQADCQGRIKELEEKYSKSRLFSELKKKKQNIDSAIEGYIAKFSSAINTIVQGLNDAVVQTKVLFDCFCREPESFEQAFVSLEDLKKQYKKAYVKMLEKRVIFTEDQVAKLLSPIQSQLEEMEKQLALAREKQEKAFQDVIQSFAQTINSIGKLAEKVMSITIKDEYKSEDLLKQMQVQREKVYQMLREMETCYSDLYREKATKLQNYMKMVEKQVAEAQEYINRLKAFYGQHAGEIKACETLEIPWSDTLTRKAVRDAHKHLALIWHPDKYNEKLGVSKEEAKKKYTAIEEAYQLLMTKFEKKEEEKD